MLSRVALGPTESFILQHNMTATLFNMSTPSSTQNGIIYVETTDPSKYQRNYSWESHGTNGTSTAIFTSIRGRLTSVHLSFLSRQSGFQQCTFWKVMAPSESVSYYMQEMVNGQEFPRND